ncbi:hypothetical protein [Nostoc sp.]|uniref:hypothetical protein n=1 Tax=Nostoc sp. TaxID=1180 RepID=UPI002FF7B48E
MGNSHTWQVELWELENILNTHVTGGDSFNLLSNICDENIRNALKKRSSTTVSLLASAENIPVLTEASSVQMTKPTVFNNNISIGTNSVPQ